MTWAEARKEQQPLASSQNEVQLNTRHFHDTLQGACTAFILECKKAPPSKSVIHDDFNPTRIATIYGHYTSVTSVLADEKYFQGSFDFLPIVSQIAPQPILRKDFIIDPYRIYLARYYQADACLLMFSVLDGGQYRQLATIAYSLEMDVLTEVNSGEGLGHATALGAKVAGIDNRDLRDLSIDLNRIRELAPELGHNVTITNGSSINTYVQVCELSHFANDFLIGSALMVHDDLNAAVRRVLLGENRVCGLTHEQDAKAVYDTGAIYGELISVVTSLCCVNVRQVQKIVAAVPLQYIGMFRSHNIANVADKARVLSLAAMQLHGSGDQPCIDNLCEVLPAHVTIWKALSVGETLPACDFQHIGKCVFGSGQGGSGQCFDQSLSNNQSLGSVLLAGGLGADNYVEAARTDCAGLDSNLVVESQSGIKDACPLASVLRTLRVYQGKE